MLFRSRGHVGRPALTYRLTPTAEALYPKSYGELASALLESARVTLDTNERRGLYTLFVERFIARAASVVLYSPQRLYVVPQHLDGAPEVILANPGSRFHDIHRWTLR